MATDAPPTLQLVIEKGPRGGETLEFTPNSTVRIGRLVRGNNLPIKDDGISGKHLSIKFDSGAGKWVVTDLDSSNGTILNSIELKPLSPFELRHGDQIKIGEFTAIRVEIVEIAGELCHRRNPRRKNGWLDLGAKVVEQCSNLGEGNSVRVRDLKGGDEQKGVDGGQNSGRQNRRGRGIGRLKKESVLADGNDENNGSVGVDLNMEVMKPKHERGMGTRRTRSSKRDGDEFLILEVVPVRKTRSKKNIEEELENEAFYVGNSKEAKNVNLVVSNKTRGRGRKKKIDVECSGNVKDVILEDTATSVASQLEVPDARQLHHEEPIGDAGQQHSLEDKMTAKKSELEVVDVREEPHEELMGGNFQQSTLEDKVTREVSKAELPEQLGGVKRQPCEQPMDNMAPENDNGVGTSHFVQNSSERLETGMVLEGGRVEKTEMGEVCEEQDTDDGGEKDQETESVPDFENMTLGEWFDYLEVCIPKQIYAVTNEITVDMRKRAKQFADFMLQQQNEKVE